MVAVTLPGYGDLLRVVFSATAISVSSAIVAGLGLSFVLHRIFARWVENDSSDVITLVAGNLLLAAASDRACLFPKPHASQIDPLSALRVASCLDNLGLSSRSKKSSVPQ